MKQLLTLIVALLLTAPAFAFSTDDNELLLGADAPYLVELADNHFLGTEVTHDNSGEWDDSWTATAKYTYTGTLFDFNLDKN